MKLNVLIVTKDVWKTREAKHEQIRRLMIGGKITDVQFTTLIKDVGTPEVIDGRITETWFENNISKLGKGIYNFCIFQFSEKDGVKWGVDSGIRGHNFQDSDMFGESWVCSNEKSVVRFNDGTKRDKYTKVVPHEIAHELKRQGETTLEIHDYDFQNQINKIEEFYFKLNNTSSILDQLKTKIVGLQEQLAQMQYTKPFKEWDQVSQEYGVDDAKTYPITGHHIGTDFRTPLGTEIKAPKECSITNSGFSTALGFWCEVKIDDWYMVCAHLKEQPAMKDYKKGETLGIIGKTGKIFGVHAHIEGWYKPMDRKALNLTSWNTLTFNIKNKIK